jgi:hypothetical protein
MIRSAYKKGLERKQIPDKGMLAHYQLIWNKNTRGMAAKCHPHMPHQQFEHIYVFFRKGSSNVKWYDREGLGNVLTFYTEESAKSSLDVVRRNSSKQFDMKPQEILRRLVQTYTNLCDTVVDFAMAKGATGEAVLHERRNFIGFEIVTSQYSFAHQRLLERAPFGNCKIPRASSATPAAATSAEEISKETEDCVAEPQELQGEESEMEWEVKRILQERRSAGKDEFLVEWAMGDKTWEPLEGVKELEAFAEYRRRQEAKGGDLKAIGGKRPPGRAPAGKKWDTEKGWVQNKVPRTNSTESIMEDAVDVTAAMSHDDSSSTSSLDKRPIYQVNENGQSNSIGTNVWNRKCGTPGCFLRDGHDLAHRDAYGDVLMV